MIRGRVVYRIDGAGVQFAPITFPFPGSANAAVTLDAPAVADPDAAAVVVSVGIEGELTHDQALAEAAAVATAVADRLAYEWGRYLPTPAQTDVSFDEDGVMRLGSTVGLFCRAAFVHVLGPDSAAKLRDVVSRSDYPGEVHLATLRAALGCSDPIGQFLCLYGILMTLAGDEQKAIDALIERHEPGQTLTPRPDRPKASETAYTRLRNEVAHRLKSRSVGAIRSEMEQRLTPLTAILRKAIAEQP